MRNKQQRAIRRAIVCPGLAAIVSAGAGVPAARGTAERRVLGATTGARRAARNGGSITARQASSATRRNKKRSTLSQALRRKNIKAAGQESTCRVALGAAHSTQPARRLPQHLSPASQHGLPTKQHEPSAAALCVAQHFAPGWQHGPPSSQQDEVAAACAKPVPCTVQAAELAAQHLVPASQHGLPRKQQEFAVSSGVAAARPD